MSEGKWKWHWPNELAAWEVNHRDKVPAPLYLAQEALKVDPNDDKTPQHPKMDDLFSGFETTPHRGRLYQPTPRLRLWQQQRQAEMQERQRAARANSISVKSANPYDRMRL